MPTHDAVREYRSRNFFLPADGSPARSTFAA